MNLVEGERELILQNIAELFKSYQPERENLIPVLQDLQDRLGYLPALAMEKIAETLNIPTVDVYGLATFYNQFRLNPPGKHQFKVCMGTACYMVGGDIAMDSFERRLSIKEGETTADRNFSLERVACVGCCTLAPVIVRDGTIEGHVTPTRVDGLIDGLLMEMEKAEKKQAEEKHEAEGEQEA